MKNEMISCACGCGQLRERYDKRGRKRNFIAGHQSQYQQHEKNSHYKPEIHTDEKTLCACGCGELRLRFDKDGRERKYIWGHKNRFKKGKSYFPETQFKEGHKLTPDLENKRRQNISKGRLGIRFTADHCENISKHRRGIPNPKISIFMKEQIGSKSHHWKGGITPLNKKLRADSMYKIWRQLIFLRDNFTCQNPDCTYCKNKIGGTIHSHHIKIFSEFPELRFRIGNGITLCKKFHQSIKNKEKEYENLFEKVLSLKQAQTIEVMQA